MTKKARWIATATAAIVAAVAVAGVAGIGVATQRGGLEHAPAFTLATPEPLLMPLGAAAEVDNVAIADALRSHIGPELATLGAQVTDTTTGEVIFAQDADRPLLPASSTKLLTAAAALYELGQDDQITTEVYRDAAEPGVITIKAAGDVWLTDERLDELAEKIRQSGGPAVEEVRVDLTAWDGPEFNPGWDEADIDGGFIAPMQPLMLYGARLGGTTGDLPRSRTPAADVVAALAARLGATAAGEGSATGEAIAATSSPMLVERINAMIDDSDNVMAEAIGREIARHRGLGAEQAPAAVLGVLTEHGLATDAITLTDTSGLSVDNRIPALALDEVLNQAVSGEQLRPLLGALPVAAGSGTLVDRYAGMSGAGWVRAKTGTLTEVSALAGVVPAVSGHVYSFAFISNGSDILAARVALDELASTLRGGTEGTETTQPQP